MRTLLILALGLMLTPGALADSIGERMARQANALGFNAADVQLLKKDADQAILELIPYKNKKLGASETLPASVTKVLDDFLVLGPRYKIRAEQMLDLMAEFAVGINEVSIAPDTTKIRNAFVPLRKLFTGKETSGVELLNLYAPMMKAGLTETLATEPAKRTTPPPSKGMAESLRAARKITDFAKKNGVSTTEMLSASKALEAGMGR